MLVLMPGYRTLKYVRVPGAADAGEMNLNETFADAGSATAALRSLRDGGYPAEPLAIRLLYGGSAFPGPVALTGETAARLRSLAAGAPLHIAAALRLVEAVLRAPDARAVLLFETSFFTALPEREYAAGVDPDLASRMDLRRFGYRGLFHEAAVRSLAREWHKSGRPARRTLSICLEPKPELTAVLGARPVMVTGGMTPLEGLPGETSCGDLDPSIILALAQELKWGPEQIDAALSRESGLSGLAGRRVTLPEVFGSAPELAEARRVFEHRLLLAAGAGAAALGGVDGIVFSGVYAGLGSRLGPWLAARLALAGGPDSAPPWTLLRRSLPEVIADAARPLLANASSSAPAAPAA